MSFSETTKSEILFIPLKTACCRRALGAGETFGLPKTESGDFILSSADSQILAAAEQGLEARFNGDFEVLFRGKKNKKELLIFKSKAAEALANSADISGEIRCKGCAKAFLRGLFLSCATISDPNTASYHAEFVIPDAFRARGAFNFLAQIGYTPKIINRKNGTGLYFKDSEVIEDLLVRLGANNAAFELMNCKIERSLRNNENRATNCVARNISKTVSASRRQVEDIIKLEKNGRLESLPYDIRVTAKLRLENPEVSLSELAAMHKPPISKSGLNHRFEKIAAESEKNSNL